MNKSELLRYWNLRLAKQQGLATGESLVGPVPTTGEAGGHPLKMAGGEISAAAGSQSSINRRGIVAARPACF